MFYGTVHISDCNKLVSLFSVNVARGLVNLHTLSILGCRSLMEVIWDGDDGNIDMEHIERVIEL